MEDQLSIRRRGSAATRILGGRASESLEPSETAPSRSASAPASLEGSGVARAPSHLASRRSLSESLKGDVCLIWGPSESLEG